MELTEEELIEVWNLSDHSYRSRVELFIALRDDNVAENVARFAQTVKARNVEVTPKGITADAQSQQLQPQPQPQPQPLSQPQSGAVKTRLVLRPVRAEAL